VGGAEAGFQRARLFVFVVKLEASAARGRRLVARGVLPITNQKIFNCHDFAKHALKKRGRRPAEAGRRMVD